MPGKYLICLIQELRWFYLQMAWFRPNGRLYDGNGIEVDIADMPAPTGFLGGSDEVLHEAIGWMKRPV